MLTIDDVTHMCVLRMFTIDDVSHLRVQCMLTIDDVTHIVLCMCAFDDIKHVHYVRTLFITSHIYVYYVCTL